VVFASFLAIVFFLPTYFVIQITMKGDIPPVFTWWASHKFSLSGQLNDSVPDFTASEQGPATSAAAH